MSKFIFILGSVDKKLIWPFIYALNHILTYLINDKYFKEKQHKSVSSVGSALGEILIILIPYISRFKDKNQKNEKKEKICSKKNIKYFSLLILFDCVFHGVVYLYSLYSHILNMHNTTFCTREAMEIIVITLVTLLILKYKYFRHHIISLIIFCLLSVGIDFILDNFKEHILNKEFMELLLNFLTILLETLNYCYHKYLMESLYYHYWSLCFILGVVLFFQTFSFGIYLAISEYNDEDKSIKNMEIGYIILGFFINIILGFFQYLARILTLDYYSPNYMLIVYELIKIFIVLMESKSENKWYSLILFVVQFLVLMFYLEIFECNFCHLNKNTKKNVQNRAQSEELIDDKTSSRSTYAEVGSGYVIKDSRS